MRRRHVDVDARKDVANRQHDVVSLRARIAWLRGLPAHARDTGLLVERELPEIARALQLGSRDHRVPRVRLKRANRLTVLVVARHAVGVGVFERLCRISPTRAVGQRLLEHTRERLAIVLSEHAADLVRMFPQLVERPRRYDVEAIFKRQQIAHVLVRGLDEPRAVVVDRVGVGLRLQLRDRRLQLLILRRRQRRNVARDGIAAGFLGLARDGIAEDLRAGRVAQIRERRNERLRTRDDVLIDRLRETSEIRPCPSEPPRVRLSHRPATDQRCHLLAAYPPAETAYRVVQLRPAPSTALR